MTDKPHNSEKWTVARFHSFIKGGLRQISYRWPPKHEVKKAAWVKRGLYKCEGYKRKWHTAPTSILEKGKRVNNVFLFGSSCGSTSRTQQSRGAALSGGNGYCGVRGSGDRKSVV